MARRRQFLIGVATASTVTIAGCSGNGGDDTGGESQGGSDGDDSSNRENEMSDTQIQFDNREPPEGELVVPIRKSAQISGIVRGISQSNIRLIANSTDSSKEFRETWDGEEMAIGPEGRFILTWDTTAYLVGSEFEVSVRNKGEVEKKVDGFFTEYNPLSVYGKRDFEFNINNKNSDGMVEVPRSETAEISGTVSGFEEGDEISIRITSTDASESFRMGEEVVVGSDDQYRFNVTFDLSDQQVGDEFEISIGGQSENGVIVEN